MKELLHGRTTPLHEGLPLELPSGTTTPWKNYPVEGLPPEGLPHYGYPAESITPGEEQLENGQQAGFMHPTRMFSCSI